MANQQLTVPYGPLIIKGYDGWVGTYSDTDVSYPIYGNYGNSKQGAAVDGYKEKIRRRQDASSYYKRTSLVNLRRAVIKGWGEAYNDTRWYRSFVGHCIIGCHIDPSLPIITTDAVARDIAVSRLKRQYSNQLSSYNVLVPLAELRELRGLVRSMAKLTLNTLTSVRKILVDPSSGGFRRARDARKYLGDLWLTWSFGFSPMMADAAGVANSIAAYVNRSDHISRLTSSARTQLKSQKPWALDTTWMIHMPLAHQTSLETEISYRFVSSWLFNLESAADYTAAEHLGFSFRSLPSTFWELTPYSWLIDYFTTVGAFLDDTFSGTSGSSIFTVECRRSRTKITTDYKGILSFNDPPHSASGWSQEGSAISEYFEFERSPLSSLPSRVLRFRTLDEIGLGSVNKVLNLASLLATRR